MPNALLAVIPLTGVPSGAIDARWRAGVPETEGVPAKKRGTRGGAFVMDCSTDWLSPVFSMSTSSDVGKSSAGGDDMVGWFGGRFSGRRSSQCHDAPISWL
jgi:hypothetical protein